jgi:hypothetical protein
MPLDILVDSDVITELQGVMNESKIGELTCNKINPCTKAVWANLMVGSHTQYLRQPNTVAFIVEGEILLEIAQVLDPTWFSRGPSLQVSKYAVGTRFLEVSPKISEPSQFLMADSVIEVEKLILVGFLKSRNNDLDQTLFPTPTIFEQYSNHTSSMVGQGMLQLIKHPLKEAEERPK